MVSGASVVVSPTSVISCAAFDQQPREIFQQIGGAIGVLQPLTDMDVRYSLPRQRLIERRGKATMNLSESVINHPGLNHTRSQKSVYGSCGSPVSVVQVRNAKSASHRPALDQCRRQPTGFGFLSSSTYSGGRPAWFGSEGVQQAKSALHSSGISSGVSISAIWSR